MKGGHGRERMVSITNFLDRIRPRKPVRSFLVLTDYFQFLLDEEELRYVEIIRSILSLGPNEFNDAIIAAAIQRGI